MQLEDAYNSEKRPRSGAISENEHKQYQLWEEFLQRWPIARLRKMKLEDYSKADSKDSFVYWMEFATLPLGSIKGGGAFKSGIYERKQKVKELRPHFMHDSHYSWYRKYGEDRAAVFKKIREAIAACAEAAAAGDFAAVDNIDLGNAYKWKTAFLYQDRNRPVLVPVYKAEVFKAVLENLPKKTPFSALQLAAADLRGERGIFEYANSIFERAASKLEQPLTAEAALEYFQEIGDRYTPIKPATIYIAGFQNIAGRQLALVLKNKTPSVFVSPGSWFDNVASLFGQVERYQPGSSRHSNLKANTPALAEGAPAMSFAVPTMNALVALCDAYEEEQEGILNMANNDSTAAKRNVPLNQIFYGPPGTGKTFETVAAALDILDPAYLNAHRTDRAALKRRFDELDAQGDVRFVTFHQSFSYEDFVEGLRASTDSEGKLSYHVEPGIFKTICEEAGTRVTRHAEPPQSLNGRRLWKMSLGNIKGSDAVIYQECVDNNYVLLGYGGVIDFSGAKDRADIVACFQRVDTQFDPSTYAADAVELFALKMKKGDLVIVPDGLTKFRAIGEITGDYRCIDRTGKGEDYGQCRDVKWLQVYSPSVSSEQLMQVRFIPRTLYELRDSVIDLDRLAALLQVQASSGASKQTASPLIQAGAIYGGYQVLRATDDIIELKKPNGKLLPLPMSIVKELAAQVEGQKITLADIREGKGKVFEKIQDTLLEPYLVNGYSNVLPHFVEVYAAASKSTEQAADFNDRAQPKVLIIDEINRGSISRIFGELITLIEESKRRGQPEALELTLPYSKERFSVPDNVYLIGTMNTADRSLTGIDTALRRRFVFKEMPPRLQELEGIEIEGISVSKMLERINQRISALIGRDYCIGHAYFIGLRENPRLTALASVFQLSILPLLKEYFFERWEQISLVLNDHQKQVQHRFVTEDNTSLAELFGDGLEDHGAIRARWQLNEGALLHPESFRGIISVKAAE